ncbi:MAG: hypothetical protein ABIJ59_13225 [Pseudomonadota bacterium]
MDTTNYKIKIETPDPGYEPFPVSIMNRSTSEVLKFNPSKGESANISYRLNQAGCIRIRLVSKTDHKLLIKTLQDWTQQAFGEYSLRWDGSDESGNIVDNKRVFVLFEAKDQKDGLQHQSHNEDVCRDPKITVETIPQTSEIISGNVEIKTSFKTEMMFDCNIGAELRYYIDYELFKKEDISKLLTDHILELDTSILRNGKHLITVNVDDRHDHIGSAGVIISVDN